MEARAPAARLVIRRPELSAPVLARVVAAMAARVDLPVDRLADAQIVTAAVASAASRHLSNGELCLELDGQPGAVSLRLGPLPAGAAAHVMEDSAVPGVGAIVERLVDRWSVETADDGQESLVLAIAAGNGSPS